MEFPRSNRNGALTANLIPSNNVFLRNSS